MKTIAFFLILGLPSYLALPKALDCWRKWKETGKVLHLSNAVSCAVVMVLFYISAVVIVIMKLLGMA